MEQISLIKVSHNRYNIIEKGNIILGWWWCFIAKKMTEGHEVDDWVQ